MSVLIFAELDQGEVKVASLEALYYGANVAQELQTSATALVIGTTSADLASLGQYGVTKVLHVSDEKLNAANALAYASVLAAAVELEQASVIVIAKSSLGDTLAARSAGKLKAGLVSNVTELPDTSNGFRVKHSIYTGKAFAITEMREGRKILTLKKNVVSPELSQATASVESFSPSIPETDFVAKVIQTEKATGEISLSDADIIVSGGRGMKGPEHWKPLEELAEALHAATGCSKPVSDLDWRPHHEHIGQTGLKVSPNVYIACGISGAIQHLAGVNGSKVIVVINKDPEAPFFKAADYGIVGDVFDILPRLTKAAREQLV
ncbi:electron transfer flavoprotein subunit alpha [Siphonobacter sp. BAB-5405]|uniref:electron transfer flavoprotein subunit alpha/FixB family protein n=1 Tax=Siphonobacter sp. BAB-5405 TaxID=1864825 RepID=UPI000C7FBD9D|nr:electron transfer flavoprotein subunit alpha/FixB family protein [Siphonobacter sp. BAB-5405]PMD92826.1 electron transfer flavoprotein subunit alpha [Siphonobacter sp. BAB-5405]